MKNKIVIAIISIVIITIVGLILWMKNSVSSDEILKTAVREQELPDGEYILCKEARVTGFDWMVVHNGQGEKIQEFCKITGSNPFEEVPLSYEFSMAHNIFVFHVVEKKIFYSDEMKQDCVEYVVSGWDILYPVKHGGLSGFLKPNNHIIKSGLHDD